MDISKYPALTTCVSDLSRQDVTSSEEPINFFFDFFNLVEAREIFASFLREYMRKRVEHSHAEISEAERFLKLLRNVINKLKKDKKSAQREIEAFFKAFDLQICRFFLFEFIDEWIISDKRWTAKRRAQVFLFYKLISTLVDAIYVMYVDSKE